MENPFDEILTRLNRIDAKISQLEIKGKTAPRIVTMDQFCSYTHQKKSSVYQLLHNNPESVPGAFKRPGSSLWQFDLDKWDQYIEKASN